MINTEICYGGVIRSIQTIEVKILYLPFDRGASSLEYSVILPIISEEIPIDRSYDAKLN